MAADALDVLTLPEGYRAINVASSAVDGTGNHDAALQQVITNVSRILDDIIGPIVNRTVTEYHDGGGTVIRPRQTPLVSVTTLKEAKGGTTTTLTAETFGGATGTYLLDNDDSYAHRCRIYRRQGGFDHTFGHGRRNIELVYTAGRVADTESVGARYKAAASAVLRRMWDREAGAWSRAADPFEQGQASSRFFDAVKYVVSEQLASEMKPPAVA